MSERKPYQPNWPSREEWAERTRTAYWDSENPIPNAASRALSDYTTPDEVASLLADLKRSYSEYGRKLREAKTACSDLIAQSGKTRGERIAAWCAFSQSDRDRLDPVHNAEEKRRQINRATKMLRDDVIPRHHMDGGNLPELAEVSKRYEEAKRAAEQAYVDKVAQKPIDDAAWEKELKRRRGLEEYFARNHIIRV